MKFKNTLLQSIELLLEELDPKSLKPELLCPPELESLLPNNIINIIQIIKIVIKMTELIRIIAKEILKINIAIPVDNLRQ